jgi:hypothetical protein
MVRRMNLIWKSLLALVLVVPLGGALAWSATRADLRDPGPRDAIVIRQTGNTSNTNTSDDHPHQHHSRNGHPEDRTPHHHRRGNDDGHHAQGTADGVTSVRVEPEDVGDDHGQHAEPGDDHGGLRSGSDDSRSGSDDHRGHSGSDDHGGHSGRH